MTSLPLELGQVSDPTARRALEQISLRWPTAGGAWTQLTQAQYNALPYKDPNTLYVIIG